MSTPDYATPYAELRERVSTLVREHADRADVVAPATPEWRVRDVLSHMVGVCDDVLTGNLDGVTTEAWTAAHVDKRRDHSARISSTEWSETGPRIEEQMRAAPIREFGQMLFDAVTHEHDIRGALGTPGARDSSAVAVAFDWLVTVRMADDARCTFVTEYGTTSSGSGPEQLFTVHASRFEIVRGVPGRRSTKQLLAWEWEGVPRPEYFGAPPVFHRAEVDVVE